MNEPVTTECTKNDKVPKVYSLLEVASISVHIPETTLFLVYTRGFRVSRFIFALGFKIRKSE